MSRIRIKTDASYRSDDGIGMGYVANYDGDTITGRGYIDKKCASHKAEMISTAWSVHNFSERQNLSLSNHELVIKTDSECTVNKFDEGHDSTEIKILDYYSNVYDKMLMFWIPRENNTHADAIAREMLRKGAEGEL